VSSSPECYREAVAAIQLDAGGCLRKYSGRTTVPILCIANKLDLIRNRREYTLLLWCLSVPEALTTGPISGEVRPESDDMSPIPAKVLAVAKQTPQQTLEMPDPECIWSSSDLTFGTIHELFKVAHPNDGRLYHGRLQTHWQR